MPIDILPDEVLAMVIRRAEHPVRRSRGLWETAHPVLSVCRRWRRVALPVVYQELYVWCEESADADSAPGASSVLASNASLIVDLGVAHMARSICITMFYSVHPAACMERLMAMLQSTVAGRAWPSVRKLDLFIHPVADDVLTSNFRTARLARSFALLMPGIVDISLDDHVADTFTLSMYRSLLGAYAHQLRRLETSYIWGTRAQSLGSPTSMWIRFDMMHCRAMPSVALDGLVSLRLDGASTSRVWNLLAGSTAQTAVLSNLEQLCVSYAQDDLVTHDDPGLSQTPALGLEFPRLRELTVHRANERCPATTSATLPPAMAVINLDCTASAFCRFAARNMPQTHAMRLAIDCEDDADYPRLFTLLCRVVARTRKVLSVRLRAASDRFVSECGLLEWPEFTRITIVHSATTASIASIVRRLPRLAELIVCGLECSPDSSQAALPLQLSLKVLTLHFSSSSFTEDGALACLLHCVQCMPGLELVRVIQLDRAHVAQMIRSHMQAHPHLANVQFVCAGGQMAVSGWLLVQMLDAPLDAPLTSASNAEHTLWQL